MSFSKVLTADSAGPAWQRAFHTSSYALAGLIPAGLVSPEGGVLAKVADVGLAAAIPFHTHVGLNLVVSDYVPRALQMPARFGVLGLSAITFAGLLKLSLLGNGVTGSLKDLWRKESK